MSYKSSFKITFNHVRLQKGDPVSVIASFGGKSTTILVKLKESIKSE